MSCPEIVDDGYLKEYKQRMSGIIIILHFVINLGAWWAGYLGFFGTGTWGPRDLGMWMPGNLNAGDLGNVGLWTCVSRCLGTWGTAVLGTLELASPIC